MRRLLGLLLIGCVLTLVAAVPATTAVKSIGVVKSLGDFRVDGATIRGNSNVFEGNVIESIAARSTVQLGETELTLLPDSTAKVYHNRMVIEKGAGVVRDGATRIIEAGTLQITPTAKDATVMVRMTGPKTVTVSTEGGDAQVRTSTGILVASLRSGTALAFTPQAGAATVVKMTGVLESTNGRLFITDKTTKVRAELRGMRSVSACQGKEVQITGSIVPGVAATAGASQVVQVAKVESSNSSCASAAGTAVVGGAAAAGAGAAGAGAAAGGAAAAGAAAATGATIAGVSVATAVVVGGAAAAGLTVAGLAAAGTFSSAP